ncbi:redoxin domain-containing protein [uncultured Croceitalea sp.]|uniref:redoxin domain-containing protein n=1 Tax=uncultured Croceitalea sp. TaxID=1798908 RepID=UPI00374E8D9D
MRIAVHIHLKWALAVTTMLVCFCCANVKEEEKQCQISGTFNGLQNSEITLYEFTGNGEHVVLDAAILQDNYFELTSNVSEPKQAYISWNHKYVTPLFIVEGEIYLEADTMNRLSYNDFREIRPLYKHSKINNEYLEYLKAIDSLDNLPRFKEKINLIKNYEYVSSANDSTRHKELKTQLFKYHEEREAELKNILKVFVLKNSTSVVSPYLLLYSEAGFLATKYTLEEIEHLFLSLDTSLENTSYYADCKKQIVLKKRVSKGKYAPDFSLGTPDGSKLSLSDFKGKYVYLNFWAHWCKPCIDTFPKLEEIYAIYNKHDFEIINISDDPNEELWKAALKEHDLPWSQVIVDLKKEQSAKITETYNVNYLPTTFLIDKEGKILAQDMNESDLMDFLKNNIELN